MITIWDNMTYTIIDLKIAVAYFKFSNRNQEAFLRFSSSRILAAFS